MKLIKGASIMTCGGSAPSPPPPPPPPVEQQDAGVVASRDNQRRLRRAKASNTFLTSFDNNAAPVVGTKTLLGQ